MRTALAVGAVCWAWVAAAGAPCTAADAPVTPGKWVKAPWGDDTAMSDPTFPKKSYPALFARADKALAVLQRALPNPVGLVIQHEHAVRGDALVKDGLIPYGLNTRWFDYYCARQGFSQPGQAGKVLPEDESGTVVEIFFNGLGWLMNDRLKVHFKTPNGASIYYVPKTGGELLGSTVYLPQVTWGDRAKAVVFTSDGRPPYKPLTRERFILSREKLIDSRIDELMKGQPWAGREGAKAKLEAEKAQLASVLAAMSDADKKTQAVIAEPEADLAKKPLFVTEEQGGRPLATVDGKLFHAPGARDAIRVITVYWKRDERDSPKSAALEQLEQHLDWAALKGLLEH